MDGRPNYLGQPDSAQQGTAVYDPKGTTPIPQAVSAPEKEKPAPLSC